MSLGTQKAGRLDAREQVCCARQGAGLLRQAGSRSVAPGRPAVSDTKLAGQWVAARTYRFCKAQPFPQYAPYANTRTWVPAQATRVGLGGVVDGGVDAVDTVSDDLGGVDAITDRLCRLRDGEVGRRPCAGGGEVRGRERRLAQVDLKLCNLVSGDVAAILAARHGKRRRHALSAPQARRIACAAVVGQAGACDIGVGRRAGNFAPWPQCELAPQQNVKRNPGTMTPSSSRPMSGLAPTPPQGRTGGSGAGGQTLLNSQTLQAARYSASLPWLALAVWKPGSLPGYSGYTRARSTELGALLHARQ
eukprot:363988-Chlamydomonas_euryale.AAC.7